MIIKKDSNQDIINNLNETINRSAKLKLYKDKKLHKVSSLEELSTLPFTTKEILREAYPFGGLAVDMDDVVEVHTSSGTTGIATLSFYTKRDLEEGSKAISEAWDNFGINKSSRLMFIMSYGLFSGAALNTYAIQKLSAFVLPAGIQAANKQVTMINDFRIDTIVATPGFLLYLSDWIEEKKFPKEQLSLKRAIAAGEIYSNSIREKIERKLGITVFDHYGLCEVNTGIAYECEERNGLHVLDDYVLAEIVDPDSGKVLPNGTYGELVLTSLKKEASPVIRYKTGDITRVIEGECACGRDRLRIDRIKARVDDMLQIKGIKINPHELKDFLFKETSDAICGDIQFVVKKNSIKFQPKIRLALKKNKKIDENKLMKSVFQETKIDFSLEVVDKSCFDRKKSNKVKLISYA